MEILPEALVGGRLVIDDGCLWLEHEEDRVLPLWLSGSRVEQDGGGYGPQHYDFVVELIGEEVPPACRGDGHYWLVYDVRAADE